MYIFTVYACICILIRIYHILYAISYITLYIYTQDIETKTRAALDDMYDTLNTDTLKAMRRVMPITRTKMEWNVSSVRMTRQVNQRK